MSSPRRRHVGFTVHCAAGVLKFIVNLCCPRTQLVPLAKEPRACRVNECRSRHVSQMTCLWAQVIMPWPGGGTRVQAEGEDVEPGSGVHNVLAARGSRWSSDHPAPEARRGDIP